MFSHSKVHIYYPEKFSLKFLKSIKQKLASVSNKNYNNPGLSMQFDTHVLNQ